MDSVICLSFWNIGKLKKIVGKKKCMGEWKRKKGLFVGS